MVESVTGEQKLPGDESFDIDKFLLFNKELQATLKHLKKQNENLVRNVTDNFKTGRRSFKVSESELDMSYQSRNS